MIDCDKLDTNPIEGDVKFVNPCELNELFDCACLAHTRTFSSHHPQNQEPFTLTYSHLVPIPAS